MHRIRVDRVLKGLEEEIGLTERKFTVIKGGVNVAMTNTKRFVSAFITDTRLMGVVGLYIHWELLNCDFSSDFHQYFYFDAEEYGFETYKSLSGNDTESLTMIEQALIGGLGGKKVDVSEREATFLVQKFVAKNESLSIPMPDTKSEYSFLLNEPTILDHAEEKALNEKLCTPITSEFQLVNYFLMRCYGRDFEAASFLAKEGLPVDTLSEEEGATLCKNSIEEYRDDEGFSYLCESLIELEDKYKIVISEITVDKLKITSTKKKSSFNVTASEAAMMLNRPEFITVYEILADLDEFVNRFSGITSNTMQTIHESGHLYLQFNRDNNHVNRKVFRLNEDIHGLYFATEYGQLIIAAYSLADIHDLEKKLKNSDVNDCLMPTAKYEFKEPILYEFIQSDFEDFTDFLEFLNSFN